MLLPVFRLRYHPTDDILHLTCGMTSVEREVSYTWNLHASYGAFGTLAELTLLNPAADRDAICLDSLRHIAHQGLEQANPVHLLTAGVLVLYFGARPELAALADDERADSGCFLDYLSYQPVLTELQRIRLRTAIRPYQVKERGEPPAGEDPLVYAWAASGSFGRAREYISYLAAPAVAYQLRRDIYGDLPQVVARYDGKASVWVATSDQVPGLVAEAPTLDRLKTVLDARVPEMTELNLDEAVRAYELTLLVGDRTIPEGGQRICSEEDFFARGRTVARLADQGKAIPERHLRSFEAPADAPLSSTAISHVTPVGGNIFADLGFPPEEAARLKADSDARQERWLLEQVVPAAQALAAGQDQGLTAEQLMQRLAHRRRRRFATRIRAEADKLAALTEPRADEELLRLVKAVDWRLVAEEFEAVVEKYTRGVFQHATRIIENLAQPTLAQGDVLELQLALDDLEDSLEDVTPDQVDAQVAEAWGAAVKLTEVRRGLSRELAPMETLADLQSGCAAKLETHRKLHQASRAYQANLSLPYEAIDALLRVAALPSPEKADVLQASAAPVWKKTATVLINAARSLEAPVCDAVLGELALELPALVDAGRLQAQGDLEKWGHSELRRPAPAAQPKE